MDGPNETELRAAFEAMDADGSGELTLDEVRAALQKNIGGYAGPNGAERYLERYDLNEDGKVTWREFLVYLQAQSDDVSEAVEEPPTPGETVERVMTEDPDLAQRLLRRFREMDTDHSGRLTYDEVAEAMRAEGREVSWPGLRREMARLDHSRDGTISYAEFLSAHAGNPASGEGSVAGIDTEV